MLGKRLSPRLKNLEDDFKNNGGEWKEVVAEKLFSIKGNPQLNKDSFVFTEDEKYPYFTRTVLNNGVSGYVEYLDEEHKIKGNSIAVGMLGMQFFYMEKDFYAGQFTKTIFPKFEYFNRKVALYFVSLLNKNQKVFQSVLVRDFEKIFNEVKLTLPFLNGEIYFSYMEKYIEELEALRIEELEALRIEELEAYLVTTGLKDYHLTKYDEEILDKFNRLSENLLDRQTDKIRLGDIFNIFTGGDFIINKSTSGTIPLVSHQHQNNGVAKYVGNYGDRKIFNFNDTISLADRGVFKASTQNENFYIGTRVKALQFKDGNKSLEQRLFIVSQINKLQVLFEEYSINATDSLPNLKIELPFKNKKLDFQFMEDFIKVIEKLVIKDVVIWSDKKIQATKKVVGKI